MTISLINNSYLLSYCDLDTRRIHKRFLEHSLTYFVCEHSVNVLVWQQIHMPHFVSITRIFLIFLDPGVNYSSLK